MTLYGEQETNGVKSAVCSISEQLKELQGHRRTMVGPLQLLKQKNRAITRCCWESSSRCPVPLGTADGGPNPTAAEGLSGEGEGNADGKRQRVCSEARKPQSPHSVVETVASTIVPRNGVQRMQTSSPFARCLPSHCKPEQEISDREKLHDKSVAKKRALDKMSFKDPTKSYQIVRLETLGGAVAGYGTKPPLLLHIFVVFSHRTRPRLRWPV